MSPSLSHFLDLAFQGQVPGSSGGEKRAARIAKFLASEVPGLDGQAIQGIGEFARICADHPQKVQELIRPRRKAVTS
jgi:hypothetical protein